MRLLRSTILVAIALSSAAPMAATQAPFDKGTPPMQGCDALPTNTGTPRLTVLPTRDVNDRFLATPVTTRGDTLLWFMDTGGGGVWLTRPALERLGISPRFLSIEEGDSVYSGGPFPTFRPDATIPPPRCNGRQIAFGFGSRPTLPEMSDAVGQLGNTYFAGRVWVLDYPAHTVSVYDQPPPPQPFGPHTIPMTLREPPRVNHPRIQVRVAGDTIDMLLDTGASSELTSAGLQAIGGPSGWRASAFVATRQWNRWRSAHPDWRVVPMAESHTNADMIEVPSLSIAGYEVGPVWFAKRADRVYDGMMAGLMDKPIQASIGGVAFRAFRITMDYVNQRVTFERR
jgi:hypothetical protein